MNSIRTANTIRISSNSRVSIDVNWLERPPVAGTPAHTKRPTRGETPETCPFSTSPHRCSVSSTRNGGVGVVRVSREDASTDAGAVHEAFSHSLVSEHRNNQLPTTERSWVTLYRYAVTRPVCHRKTHKLSRRAGDNHPQPYELSSPL